MVQAALGFPAARAEEQFPASFVQKQIPEIGVFPCANSAHNEWARLRLCSDQALTFPQVALRCLWMVRCRTPRLIARGKGPAALAEAIYARDGVDLDRSLMAQWMGKVGFELQPLADYVLEKIKQEASSWRASACNPGRRQRSRRRQRQYRRQ